MTTAIIYRARTASHIHQAMEEASTLMHTHRMEMREACAVVLDWFVDDEGYEQTLELHGLHMALEDALEGK